VIVGVAGKYCAGKNTVSQILEKHGYRVIEVDKLGHRALEERRNAIVERFGTDILQGEEPRGDYPVIDRRALGARVFGDEQARRDLEGIVHPVMVQWVRDFVEELSGAPGVINAALLIPMGLDRECDRILWVTAPLVTRIRRARARDGLGLVQVLRRFRAQKRLLPQQSSRDVEIHTVENRGTSEILEEQLRALGLLSE
jgi:dephospho-CoA kinase